MSPYRNEIRAYAKTIFRANRTFSQHTVILPNQREWNHARMLKNAYDTDLNLQKSVEDYIIDHWKDSVILTGEGRSLERGPIRFFAT